MKNHLQFREIEWGSADGKRIKIKDLDDGHLVNILNWVKDRPKVYHTNTYENLIEEAAYRRVYLFAEGKAYPMFQDGNWVLIDPDSGKSFTKPPPQEYYDKLAEYNITKEELERK